MIRPILTLLALAATLPATAQTLIVGNKGEDTISLIDLPTGRERVRLPTASMPHEVAVAPDGRRAAIVAYGGNTIDLIDVASGKMIERIDLGTNRRPHGLVWLADNRLVATTEGSDTLTVVLANARGAPDRVHAIPTGGKGSHMVAIHRGSTAYVANMQSGSVSVIAMDGQRPLRTIANAGQEPEGIALSPDGRRLWVADRSGGGVRVFDTVTLKQVGRAATGSMPIRVALTRDGSRAYVSNFGDGTLSVIDARTLRPTRTIRVSGEKAAQQVTILFGPGDRRLYVAETGTNRVAEVDVATARVLRRIDVGRQGDGLGIAPATGAQ